jgi:hypothetical protein
MVSMKRIREVLLAGSLGALGCGTSSESSDDDSNGGGSGGASATGGASSGGSGGAAATSSGGTTGGSSTGGGQSGTASGGNGGSGNEMGWDCYTSAARCDCEQGNLPGDPITPCAVFPCCIYWVVVQNGITYPRCGCANETDADCEEQVNIFGPSTLARREDACPPP